MNDINVNFNIFFLKCYLVEIKDRTHDPEKFLRTIDPLSIAIKGEGGINRKIHHKQ